MLIAQAGHSPQVRVWRVSASECLVALGGHAHGISAVAFSADSRLVISVGNQHDNSVNVWAWRDAQPLLAASRVTSRVRGLCVTGQHFVTCGAKHVKFWSLDAGPGRALQGRSAILEQHRANLFVAVACAPPSTFTLTQSGVLCELDERRKVARWVDVRAAAHALDADARHVYVACAMARVRIFDARTLQYLAGGDLLSA